MKIPNSGPSSDVNESSVNKRPPANVVGENPLGRFVSEDESPMKVDLKLLLCLMTINMILFLSLGRYNAYGGVWKSQNHK